MDSALQEFLTANVFAFILTFVRVGTAVMIMPGIGDSFVPERIRLHIAIGLSVVMFPLTLAYMPSPVPATAGLLVLIVTEFITGLFFGTVARIFMTALDTAGMVISFASSLSNAQLFNPTLSAQGSLVGAFLSVTGMVLLMAANMHHLLIMGIFESYQTFPVGGLPDAGSMAEMITRAISASFSVGIKISAPFIIMTLVLYVLMGVLSRLMPQMQVFMIALPLQIMISLLALSLVLSAGMLYWLKEFEAGMVFFLKAAQ